MNRLELKNLKIIFHSVHGFIPVVEGIDLTIEEGKCVALVGESGSGKSVTGLSVMQLLQTPPAIYKADKSTFTKSNGEKVELFNLSEPLMNQLRLKEIAMIFQDPSSTLNPVLTIGEQLDEIFIYHEHLNKKQAKEKTIEMLKKVQIPSPEKRYEQFPHELSGGMKQRIMIAIAFALKPSLIIADEPTTALDVSVQSQVLSLFKELQKEYNTSVLFITHDLSVVRAIADEIYVLYSGKILEHGTIDVLDNPIHPYTKGLLESIPDIDSTSQEFKSIPNSISKPTNKPKGCYFCERCIYAKDVCFSKMPLLKDYNGREIRCFRGDK